MRTQLLLLLFALVCIHPANTAVIGNATSCLVVLFEHNVKTGRFLVAMKPTSDLPSFGVRTVQVIRCQWKFFFGTGKSVVLGPGQHDLTRYIGNNKLASVKPYEPDGVCTVSSDPHFYTFDGNAIHFMGICTYTLAKPCNVTSKHLEDFHVMMKGERRYGNFKVSYVKYLLVDVGGLRFQLGKNRVVFLNGEKINLPVTKNAVTVHLTGRNVELYTKFGLKVTFDGNHRSSVTVPAKYKKQMSGICGNWNGNKQDDMKDSKGVLQKGYAAVGNSWIVPGVDVKCTKEPERPPKCSEEQKRVIQGANWCGRLRSGPFTKCHKAVNYQDFERSCQYDLCELGTTKKVFCKSLEAYADECAREGVSADWRTWAGCPLPCPPNSRYKFCTSACPNTCRNPTAVKTCKKRCVEGCECTPGFIMSGQKCVPRDQCGCVFDGFYRQRGETWTENNCQKKHKCIGGHKVVTTALGCKKFPNSECKLSNGSWGCYCKANYTMKNGKCKKNVIVIPNVCPDGYEIKFENGTISCVLKTLAG